ncbi:hypothetical protein [Streptomyces sp. NPDC088847]|uniref:hypothetical protein n=1 Tax=Streptomyces sp. NPDC088847 TaxID=3365909 RepID=UPI00382D57D4
MYNNVAWNRTTYGAVLINPNGRSTSGDRIYNNTSGTDTNVATTFGGTYSDTEIVNNIGVTGNDPGITNSNNFISRFGGDHEWQEGELRVVLHARALGTLGAPLESIRESGRSGAQALAQAIRERTARTADHLAPRPASA